MRRHSASGVAGLGMILVAAAGCSRGDSSENAPDRVVPAVEAVQARHGALPLTQRLSGVVRGKNQIGIYPEISAVITEVLVQNGDSVRQGQPLVRLRNTEYQERLKQAQAGRQVATAELRRAEAQAREARAELERVRVLTGKQYTSEAELDAAEARAESAEAEVELARARVEQAIAGAEEQSENLTQTILRAPIAGTVGSRNAEVGMLAGSDTRLFTLGRLDSVRVQITLTDRMLARIEPGQRVEVSAMETTLAARLSRISPFLHPVAHSTEAEIDLHNAGQRLKPGMFVKVEVFHGESAEATLVPLSALYEHPETGVVGVYVTDAELEARPVADPGTPETEALTDPVAFEFVPVDLVAEGRMEAGVRGVEPESWVMTVGQNLLGGEAGEARVRPVTWSRVERLQNLQREDLMDELIQQRGPAQRGQAL